MVYGHGTDPRHVTLPGHDLMKALKTANVLLDLEVEGDHLLVLPKSVQRDPIKGTLEHVDLVIVRRGEKVTVDVGVHVSGEVGHGGMLDQQLVTLSVEAEATSIPHRLPRQHRRDGDRRLGAREGRRAAGRHDAGDRPDALVLHVLSAPTAEQIDAEMAEAEAEAGIEHDAPTVAPERETGDATERVPAVRATPRRLEHLSAARRTRERRGRRDGSPWTRWFARRHGDDGSRTPWPSPGWWSVWATRARLRRQPAQPRLHGRRPLGRSPRRWLHGAHGPT